MKGKRILSFVLALVMVLGMIPFNALEVFAVSSLDTSSGTTYLDIKDGAITMDELYDHMYTMFGKYPTSVTNLGITTGGDYQYNTSGSVNQYTYAPENGTSVKDGDTSSAALAHNTTYYGFVAETHTGSWNIKSTRYNLTAAKQFTVRHYYDVAVAVSDSVPTGGGVNSTTTQKVYAGNKATLTVNKIDGYNVKITDSAGAVFNLVEAADYAFEYTPTVSTTLTVEYVEAAKPQHTVTLVTNGGSFGSVDMPNTGLQYEEQEITLTATPNANGYIVSITVEGADATIGAFDANRGKTAAFTVGSSDVTVTVTFAEKKLSANDNTEAAPIEVPFNFGKTVAAQMYGTGTVNGTDSLEQLIFNAVVNANVSLPAGVKFSDLTYEFYAVGSITGNYNSEAQSLTAEKTGYKEFAARGDGTVEKIKLTWDGDSQYPEVSVDAFIKLVEWRTAPTSIVYNMEGVVVTLDSLDELSTTGWFTVTAADGATVTYTVDTSNLTLPADGETASAGYVTVSVAANEHSLATTEAQAAVQYPVTIYNPKYDAKISVTQPTGATIKVFTDAACTTEIDYNAATHTPGTYYVQVTPTGAYYVEGLTGVTAVSEGWEKQVYTAQVEIGYGAAAVNAVTIGATTGERSIVVNTTIPAVSYNAASDKLEDIEGAIYSAIVSGSDPSGITAGDCTVTCNGDALAIGENSFTVTWNETDKYPAVSVTATVTLTEERQAAVINVDNVVRNRVYIDAAADKDITAEEIKARILAAFSGVTVTEGASELVYTICEPVTGGGEQGVAAAYTVQVDCPENDKFLAAEPKYVFITVEYTVLNPNVTVNSDAAKGTVVITDANGAAVSAGELEPGTYTVTVTPADGGYYVDQIKVNGTVINADQNTLTYTWEQTLENGEGLALGVVPQYTIDVTFGQRTITLNELGAGENYTIAIVTNPDFLAPSAQRQTIYDQILAAVVASTDPAGVSTPVVSYDVAVFGYSNVLTTNLLDSSFNDSSETIKIEYPASGKYPAVSVEGITVVITDSRPQATINYTKPAEVEFETEDEIIAAIQAAISTNSSNAIQIERVSEALPTSGAQATLTYKLSVAEDANYLASEREITIDVKAKVNPSTITVVTSLFGETTTENCGTVVITDSNGNAVTGSSFADTLTVTVTPDLNNGYYVMTVMVMDVTDADNSFPLTKYVVGTTQSGETADYYTDYVFSTDVQIQNDRAYEVQVHFEQRTVSTTEPYGSVAINGYYTANNDAKAVTGLKTKILDAVNLPDWADYADYTVTTVASVQGIEVTVLITDTGATVQGGVLNGTDVSAALAYALNGDASRSFTITLNASEDGMMPPVAKTVSLALAESRGEASIGFSSSQPPVDADAPADITIDVLKDRCDLVIPADASTTVTLEYVSGFPAGEGETATVTYRITVAENENYVETVKELTFLVTNIKHYTIADVTTPANGTITIYADAECTEVVDGTQLDNGTYYVKVTPAETAEGVYYVDGAAISAVDGVVVVGTGAYTEDYAYVVPVTVTNKTDADTSITVAADIKLHDIFLKSDEYIVTYENWSANEKKAVLDAVIDTETVDYDAYTVKLDETGLLEGQMNTFTITALATEKYPALTKTVDVLVTKELQETVITNPSIIEADELDALIVDADDAQNANLQQEILDALKTSGKIQVEGSEAEIVLTLAEGQTWPTITKQGQTETVTLDIYVPAGNGYGEAESTIAITLVGAVTNADVTLTASDNGTIAIAPVSKAAVAYAAGQYVVTLTPNANYFVDGLVVVLDGETVETYNWNEFTDNAVTIEIKDGTGYDLGVAPAYVLTAAFIDPSIKIQAVDGTMTYYPKMFGDSVEDEAVYTELEKLVMSELNITDVPAGLTGAGTNEITYLAREAGEYAVSFTVEVPFVGAKTLSGTVPMEALWLNIGEDFPTNLTAPTQETVQKMFDDILEEYSWDYLLGLLDNEEERNKFIQNVLMENEEFVLYLTYYGAHEFGANDSETIKLANHSDRFGTVECDEPVTLNLLDDRKETQIVLKQDHVEMVYGFSEADLTAAILDGVYTADGTKIDGASIQYITPVAGLNVAEEAYTITISYPGQRLLYQDCTATFTLTVTKADVSVSVDNRWIKWHEGLTYELPVVVDPADCEVITFIVGLNVSNVNFEGTSIQGIMGEVQLMIPDSLQSLLETVGIKNGVSMTVSELKELLLKAAETLGYVNSQNEAINVLLNMLESLPTDVADVTVRVGGTLPTDIGAYLVGAVSADGNYNTDFGVGAVIITPDGKKAELDWIYEDENHIITRTLLTEGIIDMGAEVVSVAEGSIEEAQSQVFELFLGVDIDGNITLETDQTKLNVGAYTEVAIVANWGNEMYYSEPIIRAFVVIAESLDVDFVDADGVNNERFFTFNNQSHVMDQVLVTYKQDGDGYLAGDVVLDTRVSGNDGNLKIYYVGAQTNGKPVLSSEAPVHAGAYTVVAVYTLRDSDNMVSHIGIGIGAMVIQPAESDIYVDNKAVEYTGNGVTTEDMIHASSAVEGLTPDTTVITAAITTDGTFSDNGLSAIYGTVNVDLPQWLDDVMTKYGILEAGYTGEGITKETFLSYVETIESALTELNITVDAISGLKNVIGQLPAGTTMTFKNQSEVAPSAVGAYLVVGVVTDSDHYPSVGAGILLIYPKTTEVELKFNKTWDDNNIFTWNYLQTYDLDASAYDLGTENVNSEATAKVTNLYLGVTDDGEIKLTNDKAQLDVGVYTQTAVLLDLDSEMYYAKPISRVFMIVPNVAEIEFVDGGNVEDATKVTYDGNAHGMEATVTVNGVLVEEPGDKLVIRYTGVQTNGKTYNSTTAPTHAGSYVVTATYTEYDSEGRLYTFGLNTALLVIEPAKAEIDVDNVAHEYGTPYNTEDMITACPVINGIAPTTTVITATLNTDGTFSENGLEAIEGEVNMDLPSWIDEILSGYDLFNDGLTAAEFVAGIESIEADLAELGITTEIFDGLVNVVNQLPETATLTFKDQSEVAPSDVGVYLVIGVVTDSNFYPAMDAGVLVIYPQVNKTELDWIEKDTNNIYTKDSLEKLNMGADVYLDGQKMEDLTANILFVGVDAENFTITLTSDKNTLGTGVYTEIAYLLQIDSVSYYAEPISRPVIVVPNVYRVEFHDGTQVNNDRKYPYDNLPKDMGTVLIDGVAYDAETMGELTITYIGNDTTVGLYYSTEKPVHAGIYTVVATYVHTDEDGDLGVGVGIGALVIEPADVDINVESHAVLYGQDYDFKIETFHNAVNDEPKTLVIMAGVDLSAYTTEGRIGIDGTVNVDFPTAVDNVLKELMPELYTTGIGTDAFFAKYDEIVAAVEAEGYDVSMLTQLKEMLQKLNAVNLTVKETEKPTETGLYVVVAMVFDPDYKSAVDTALIAIAPNATVAELDFNAKIPSLLGMDILPYDMVDDFDFGAHVGTLISTDDSLTADSIVVNDVIFGLTSDLELFLGSSTEKPQAMGIYDQIAYTTATENNLMAVLPIHRDFVITDATANVVFVDENGYVNWLREFTYDATAKDMGASLQLSDGTILTETPSVWYLGIDNGNVFYSSSEAPVNAGYYQVIGYHLDTAENIYTVGLGAMRINPRAVTVIVDDQTMTVGDAMPELTWTADNMAGNDVLDVQTATEADGTVAGEFEITATVTPNPNYVITVENGTLTVEEEVVNEIIDTGRTLSLIGEVFINQYVKVIGFEGIDIEANGGLLIWDHEVDETNALFGTESELKAGLVAEGNEFCQQTSGFAAAEYADQVWLRVYIRLEDGSYAYGPLKKFSVREYCETIIATRADGNSLKNTCIALLHYGTAAQEYFDYNLEDLANKNIVAEYPVVEMESEWINELDGFTTNIVASSDVAHAGKTLSLDSATLINYYYTFAGTANTAELLFWDGVTDELTLDNVTYKNALVYNANADEYHAQSGIYPGALYGKTIFACAHFVDENGVHHYSDVVAFSPEEYARVRMSTSKNAELVEVLKRMVTFGEYARIYFNK